MNKLIKRSNIRFNILHSNYKLLIRDDAKKHIKLNEQ